MKHLLQCNDSQEKILFCVLKSPKATVGEQGGSCSPRLSQKFKRQAPAAYEEPSSAVAWYCLSQTKAALGANLSVSSTGTQRGSFCLANKQNFHLFKVILKLNFLDFLVGEKRICINLLLSKTKIGSIIKQ